MICDDALIVGLSIIGFGFERGEIVVERLFVFIDDAGGFGNESGAVFEIDEAMGTIEGEVDFLPIE